MIITRKRFVLEVQETEEKVTFYRKATREVIPEKGQDDALATESKEDTVLVSSLSSIRRYFLKNRVINIFFAVSLWAVMLYAIYACTFTYMAGDAKWTMFPICSILILLTIVYTIQARNPIAHDVHGKWINLRTGLTNLNGGCRII